MSSPLSKMLFGIVSMLVFGIQGSIVDAQPTPVTSTPSERAQAKKLTEEAIAAQNAKDYSKAIELYLQAYQIVHHPTLLFNVGLAHMYAGNGDQAAKFYRDYLASAPDGPYAMQARELLASLSVPQSSIAQHASAPSPSQVATYTLSGSSGPASSTTHVPEAAASPSGPASLEASVDSAPRSNPPVLATRTDRQVDQVSLTSDSPLPLKERVKRSNEIDKASVPLLAFSGVAGIVALECFETDHGGAGLVFSIVGAGLAVGGVATYMSSSQRNSHSKSLAWSPMLGPKLTGIAWAGTLP